MKHPEEQGQDSKGDVCGDDVGDDDEGDRDDIEDDKGVFSQGGCSVALGIRGLCCAVCVFPSSFSREGSSTCQLPNGPLVKVFFVVVHGHTVKIYLFFLCFGAMRRLFGNVMTRSVCQRLRDSAPQKK